MIAEKTIGQCERFFQACQRSFSPGEERSNAGEEKQNQAYGNIDVIKEGRADRDFGPLNPFGQYREHRPPKNCEAGNNQYEIVKKKCALSREHGVEAPLAL